MARKYSWILQLNVLTRPIKVHERYGQLWLSQLTHKDLTLRERFACKWLDVITYILHELYKMPVKVSRY